MDDFIENTLGGIFMRQRVVIVTGGNRGIGLGIAKAFVEQGDNVVIGYYKGKAEADLALEMLNKSNGQAIAVQADLSQSEERSNLFNKALESFGRVDVLINNAGTQIAGLGILEISEKDFDWVMDCNFKAPVFLAQQAAKQMIEQGDGGVIVNVGSVAAYRYYGKMLPYSVSKIALSTATKHMACELAPHNIRVNIISPGEIKTDINRDVWHNNPDRWEERMQAVPMKRAGETNEVASAAIFLASSQASYITGADIAIDGALLC